MRSDRKRVLVLNHFAAPHGHAGGTRHVELFSKLESWDFLVLAADRNYLSGERVDCEPGFDTVRVLPFKSNGMRRIANWISYSVMAFLRGAALGRVDVVYASSPHLLAGLAGWILAVLKRASFILEVRDLWPRVLVDMGQLAERSFIYRVLERLEVFLYSRAQAIVVMAEGSRTDLLARGISSRKIAYIPNGADPESFTPSAPRATLRRELGFHQFTAIYAGAHGPANGLELLLDAAESVRDLPIEIVLVGGGVNKPKLVSQASDRGLDNVRFIDPVPKSQIPDLLAAADVGLHVLADVQLFQSAVSPNKVFDYMAAGLPVITNCPGSVTSLVEDARCGFAVKPTELHAALEAACQERLQISGLGEAGRRWIALNQSRTAMSLRLKAVLDSVVGNAGAHR